MVTLDKINQGGIIVFMSNLTAANYKNVNYCLRCGHLLELKKDNENKLRPHCPACNWIYYKNPIPAVAIVLFNENNELLLVKRRLKPKAGFWALPSGYMEINLTPEENALQELEEETGLKGKIIHCVGWFYGKSPIYERVLSIGFRIKAIGGKLQAGDDAVDAKFFPLNNLPVIAFDAHREFIAKETKP
ncbi:MAG TPA: NUDIX hydrolase [Candidatus Cloacimonas sp.]|nr:NUDIX hydrolase [Candidatus Cloacimonas sp.]